MTVEAAIAMTKEEVVSSAISWRMATAMMGTITKAATGMVAVRTGLVKFMLLAL